MLSYEDFFIEHNFLENLILYISYNDIAMLMQISKKFYARLQILLSNTIGAQLIERDARHLFQPSLKFNNSFIHPDVDLKKLYQALQLLRTFKKRDYLIAQNLIAPYFDKSEHARYLVMHSFRITQSRELGYLVLRLFQEAEERFNKNPDFFTTINLINYYHHLITSHLKWPLFLHETQTLNYSPLIQQLIKHSMQCKFDDNGKTIISEKLVLDIIKRVAFALGTFNKNFATSYSALDPDAQFKYIAALLSHKSAHHLYYLHPEFLKHDLFQFSPLRLKYFFRIEKNWLIPIFKKSAFSEIRHLLNKYGFFREKQRLMIFFSNIKIQQFVAAYKVSLTDIWYVQDIILCADKFALAPLAKLLKELAPLNDGFKITKFEQAQAFKLLLEQKLDIPQAYILAAFLDEKIIKDTIEKAKIYPYFKLKQFPTQGFQIFSQLSLLILEKVNELFVRTKVSFSFELLEFFASLIEKTQHEPHQEQIITAIFEKIPKLNELKKKPQLMTLIPYYYTGYWFNTLSFKQMLSLHVKVIEEVAKQSDSVQKILLKHLLLKYKNKKFTPRIQEVKILIANTINFLQGEERKMLKRKIATPSEERRLVTVVTQDNTIIIKIDREQFKKQRLQTQFFRSSPFPIQGEEKEDFLITHSFSQ